MNNSYKTEPSKPMMVADMATREKPRERLINYGANSLKDSELLAILLRTGLKGRSVLALAEDVLNNFQNNLSMLASANISELTKISGIGPAKAVEIKAAFTLAKRLQDYTADKPIALGTPSDSAKFLQHLLQHEEQEHFKVILLNNKNHVIHHKDITVGLVSSTQIHAREVFRYAIQWNSTRIILAHNHPSGDPKPSTQDIHISKKLKAAGEIIGIKVIDHIIIGKSFNNDEKYFTSMSSDGLL